MLFVVGFSCCGHTGWTNYFQVVPGSWTDEHSNPALVRQGSGVCRDAGCPLAWMFAQKYFTEVAHCQVWNKQRRLLRLFWGFPHTPAPNVLLLSLVPVLLSQALCLLWQPEQEQKTP